MRRTISQLNVWSITRTSALLNNVPEKIWYANLQQAGYGGKGAKKAKTSGRKLRRKGGRAGLFTFENPGGQRRTAAIPARPFVMLQDEDTTDIQKVFSKWLDERIAATWDKK
jgi:phage gpG-like protein